MLRWALLLAGVLVVHGFALFFLRDRFFEVAVVTPMPPPLFLRVLRPTAPVLPTPLHKRPPKPAVVTPQPTPHVDAVTPQAELASSAVQDAAVSETAPELAPEDAVTPPEPAAADETPPPNAQNAADKWPADTRLSYRLKGYYRGDFYGSGQVQWQHSDGRYQVQVDLRMALVFTGHLISQGEVRDDGLQPRVYEERGMGRVRRLVLDGTQVTFHDGSAQAQPPGLQDTASQFVELTRRFSSGRQTLEVGTPVSLWMARPREMNLWTYDVVALDTLQIPDLGDVAAYHLQPRSVAKPGGVINADLWFAPSLQYLPVRIRINLGGDNYADLLVNRIEQGDASTSKAP